MDNVESKKQEVVKELQEWFARPNSQEFFYDEPVKTIEENLAEAKIKKSVWLSFANLENWHENQFVLKGLTENNLSDQAMAASYGCTVVELVGVFSKLYPGNPPSIDLHSIASHLANIAIRRWIGEVRKALEVISEGLDSKLLKGGQDYKIAGWFIVIAACKAFGKDIALQKYNYPKDMGVYQQVLDKWDISDAETVDNFVSEMCEYHLSQAYYNERSSMDIQFSNSNEFVYAFEILAWLAFREMNGIANPASFSHPLMKLPLNGLPVNSAPFKPTELQEKVLAKVKSDFQL